MNRELLERPFGPEQIKQREGNFGKMLDYIEGHTVIQRLNDAFDADWSFTILKHDILAETDEVLVLGKLKTGEVVKSQFGSSRITRNKETGDFVSLSDDLKAAATDALKKCATLLGIGLHIYGEKNVKAHYPDQRHYQGGSSAPGRNQNYSNQTNNRNNNGGGNGNGRLTGNQYRYMMQLNEDKGGTKADLDQRCLEMFGSVAQYLSKKDASVVIAHLLTN
jgi:hypothetical protein